MLTAKFATTARVPINLGYTPGIPNDGIPNDGIPNYGVPNSTFGIPKQTPGSPNGGIPKSLLHVSQIIS